MLFQITGLPRTAQGDIMSSEQLPGLLSTLLLDMVIAKLQVSLDETFSNVTVSHSLFLVKSAESDGLMHKGSASQPWDCGFEPHMGHDHDSSYDTSTG